ncbi:Endonuclease/exonuclease/phosphatase [Trinorchestia longiramus]|nr:Endonuclease/exonuclease/phosphatase [Trinorchestia longiramus]
MSRDRFCCWDEPRSLLERISNVLIEPWIKVTDSALSLSVRTTHEASQRPLIWDMLVGLPLLALSLVCLPTAVLGYLLRVSASIWHPNRLPYRYLHIPSRPRNPAKGDEKADHGHISPGHAPPAAEDSQASAVLRPKDHLVFMTANVLMSYDLIVRFNNGTPVHERLPVMARRLTTHNAHLNLSPNLRDSVARLATKETVVLPQLPTVDVLLLQEVIGEEVGRQLALQLSSSYSYFLYDVAENSFAANRWLAGSGLFLASKLRIECAHFQPFTRTTNVGRIACYGALFAKLDASPLVGGGLCGSGGGGDVGGGLCGSGGDGGDVDRRDDVGGGGDVGGGDDVRGGGDIGGGDDGGGGDVGGGCGGDGGCSTFGDVDLAVVIPNGVAYVTNVHNQAYDETLLYHAASDAQNWISEFIEATLKPWEKVLCNVYGGDFNGDNISPADRPLQEHPLWGEYLDACRVGPGEEQPWAVGTEMRQKKMHFQQTRSPETFAEVLRDDVQRRFFVIDADVKAHTYDLMSCEPVPDTDGEVRAKSWGGLRRIDRLLLHTSKTFPANSTSSKTNRELSGRVDNSSVSETNSCCRSSSEPEDDQRDVLRRRKGPEPRKFGALEPLESLDLKQGKKTKVEQSSEEFSGKTIPDESISGFAKLYGKNYDDIEEADLPVIESVWFPTVLSSLTDHIPYVVQVKVSSRI